MPPILRVVLLAALVVLSIALAGCASDGSCMATQRCADTLSYCPRMMELDVDF